MPEAITNAYLSDDDATIALLSRNADGRRVVRHVPAEWIAYFKTSELDANCVRELKANNACVRSFRREGDWVRVGFANRGSRDFYVQDRSSIFLQLGVPIYEGDVSPILRYVVDNNIPIARPRHVHLDIETDSRCTFVQAKNGEARVLSWTLTDEQARVQMGCLKEDTDRAERELLVALWSALEPYDRVGAWSGDDFDFEVIWQRSTLRGCKYAVDHWLWIDYLELFRRMNLNASESGEEKQSMKLQSIAQAVTGQGKEITPPEVIERFGNKALGALTWQLWEAGGKWRDILCMYNMQDVELLRLIEKETGYLALFDTLCEVCHIFGDSRSINPTHQMDGFMLRLGLDSGYHFPTKRYRESIEKFKGAFVMDPETRGIEHNVHVCDFASLYPSVILSWNMSPDTKCQADPYDPNQCQSPTGVCFRTDVVGILPTALKELLKMRKYWSEKMASLPPGTQEWQEAKRLSNAYKVAANSFYGIVGSPFSRFFDPRIAESVTQASAWLLLQTIEAGKQKGMKAVYGDTDSVFVKGVSRLQFQAFVDWANVELYPKLLREKGCKENFIKLAYEKAFNVLVMVSAKRYIGNYRHFKGTTNCVEGCNGSVSLKTFKCDGGKNPCGRTFTEETLAAPRGRPEIKGLEYKRGDALLLARNMQAHLIDLLCGGLNVDPKVKGPTEELIHFHEVLLAVRKHVLEEPLAIDEIRLAKAISKPIKEYVNKIKKDGTPAADLAHVHIAKMLKARGADVSEGTRVEYIVTDGDCSPMKVIPADDYTGTEADRFYLWEKLVFPPSLRLLEAAFPQENWQEWLKVRPAKERAKRKQAKIEIDSTIAALVRNES